MPWRGGIDPHPSAPMNTFSPRLSCELNCPYHDTPMCLCNLVALPGNKAPISLGLRIGLTQTYGEDRMPPCVHVENGAAHWSAETDWRQSAVPQ